MKILSSIVAALMLPLLANAQDITIQGKVTSSEKEPIIGAVVMVDGSISYGVTTDNDGKYKLTFPSSIKNPVVSVSCIGYATIKQEVKKTAVINFVMEQDFLQLDQSVVVGYGSMRRSDLTGSVTSVKVDENQASQSSSVDRMLQGKAAGVQVITNSAAPDGGVSVRIRGMSTFNGSTEPLYVVDGILINSSQSDNVMTQGIESTGLNNSSSGLMGINPQDIASIEILKDASATAIYGSQGSNGVVLITTKNAIKDKPTVKLTVGTDISNRYKKMGMLDFNEYVDFVSIVQPEYLKSIYNDPETKTSLKVQPMDWQDYVTRTAVSENVYLSVSGRPNRSNYWFSLGYNNTQGIVKKTGFQNFTIRLNLDRPLDDAQKFRIGMKTGVSYLDSQMTQGASAGTLTGASSLMRSMIFTKPYMQLPGIEEDDETTATYYLSGPDKWLEDYQNTKIEVRVTPSVFAEYKITGWLTFKSTLGADFRGTNQIMFKSSRINSNTEGSIGAKGKINYLYYNWNNTFSFNKSFKRFHTISGNAGVEYVSNGSYTETVQGWNIEQYKPLIESINSAPYSSFKNVQTNCTQLSFYLRAIYNYHDRYVLTSTFRTDGSSKFYGSNKWAFFPSFAFAWRMSEERWMKNVPQISLLKLRVGWGQVGNQSISNYQTMQTYSDTRYPDHDPLNEAQNRVGIFPSNISNPNLKWETSEQTNVGLDLGLFKGRLAITIDAYYKYTKDLLQSKKIPYASGFTSMFVNLGNIENKGLEFSLETTPVKTRLFEFNLEGNISVNRNRVISIGSSSEGEDIWVGENNKIHANYFAGSKIGTSSYANYPLNMFIEGYPMGVFYGLISTGVIQEGEQGTPIGAGAAPREPGYLNYVDVNGDGYISDTDRVIIGDPNPDFTFGFGATFSIWRFSLGLNFNGSYGNDIYNVNKVCDTDVRTVTSNITRDCYYNAWTPENKKTEYPGLGKMEQIDYGSITNRYVEDGSYLRLANVSLAFDVPLKNTKVVKALNIAVNAQNLYFWTKYSGWDPDVNSFGSVYRMGADMGSYPGARAFNFRLNFTF